jgi:hypothetical protein
LKELTKYLNDNFRCNWWLTNDFLFVECEIITVEHSNQIMSYVSVDYIKIFEGYHAYCFGLIGIHESTKKYFEIIAEDNLIAKNEIIEEVEV